MHESAPICLNCKKLNVKSYKALSTVGETPKCLAFKEGIPKRIFFDNGDCKHFIAKKTTIY